MRSPTSLAVKSRFCTRYLLWPTMALADGELNPTFSDDRLHLNDAGYEAWLTELRPALVRLRDLPPMTSPIRAIMIDDYARPAPHS